MIVAILQYATAVTFLVIGLSSYRNGDAGQRAAEAEVARQGWSPALLERHQFQVREGRVELLLPLSIALVLAWLGTLHAYRYLHVGRLETDDTFARTATLIVQPILFLAGTFITSMQVFVRSVVRTTFAKSADAEARAVDTNAVLDAVYREFPFWLRPLIVIRFVLVTAGSLAILLIVY